MLKTAATGDIGLILEVDLKYPVHLYESHNDYPLAAEKVKITHYVPSQYSQSLINKHRSTENLHQIWTTRQSMFCMTKIGGCTWNWQCNSLKFTELFNSVIQLGSNHILILIQQNEKKLRHHFCKTCSNFSEAACLVKQWSAFEIGSTWN